MKNKQKTILSLLVTLVVIFILILIFSSTKTPSYFNEEIPHPKNQYLVVDEEQIGPVSDYNDLSEECNDFYFCNTNSDCIIVNEKDDCCGCEFGGKASTINKNCEFEWNNFCRSASLYCPAVISDDPSCSKEPKCINHKCTLI